MIRKQNVLSNILELRVVKHKAESELLHLLGVSSGAQPSCCQKRKLLSNRLMRKGGKKVLVRSIWAPSATCNNVMEKSIIFMLNINVVSHQIVVIESVLGFCRTLIMNSMFVTALFTVKQLEKYRLFGTFLRPEKNKKNKWGK